jgi:hypothetical protein
MAWIKSDPEHVAARVSEVRVHLVVLLDRHGWEAQQIAEGINSHFDEMVVLTECMGDWPVWVVARAMRERITDSGDDFDQTGGG